MSEGAYGFFDLRFITRAYRSATKRPLFMEMTITTPGLLFPAISLLLLAYTNRFVVLTNVIRQFRDPDLVTARRQVQSLRQRLYVIRLMQVFGVLSFVLCTLSMFALFLHWLWFGKILFGCSLILLVISLLFSLYEVQVSTNAISIELEKFDR